MLFNFPQVCDSFLVYALVVLRVLLIGLRSVSLFLNHLDSLCVLCRSLLRFLWYILSLCFYSVGFFYTELPKEILKSYPQLYKTLHTGRPLFTTGHYVLVLLSALVCALFAFIIPMSHFAVDDSTLPSGMFLGVL